MADLFYFTSPRKAATVARHRPSSGRRTAKVVRKRRAAHADMFHQRACTAQYEEPTFCPSAAPSFFASEPLLHTRGLPLAPITSSLVDLHHDLELNEEDEEDESGGVALPPCEHDPMTYVHHAATPISYNQDTQHDCNVNESMRHETTLLATTSSTNASQARRRSHLRDQLEEEDGRRTRLALDGDAADEVPQFDVEAAAPYSVSVPSVEPTGQRPLPHSSSSANARPRATPEAPPHRFPRAQQRELETARPIPDAQILRGMDTDEDALAVDDPRRHYDVAGFMDIWRLHSIADKRLPPFEPGVQSSIRLGRPPEQVTRAQTLGGAVDMQGIRWQLIGPPRHHASIARSMLHPSGVGSSHQFSQQRCCASGLAGDPETHYRFRSFVPKHKASFEHYQLRSVLVASDRNNIFYGTTGNRVVRVSLACPTMEGTIMDLTKPTNTTAAFRITCLSASSKSSMPGYKSDNVLIAGGFTGEYAIANVDGCQQQISAGFVTHAYNGLVTHVHTYQDRRSGLLRASLCSNDSQVRLMDLRTLQFTHSFIYDNAVNCSDTSPDGRLRVLVGDSTKTLITDAERGTALVTLQEHTGHGFACAWSRDGRHVATAAQDGCVVVWDARHWRKPLRKLDSVISCARSLHFTSTGALVAAENEDVVTVYGGPSFDTKQEIRFFGSIAGVALLDGGAELAVANADKTVGGLLTFERQPQGLGEGSYGQVIAKAGAQGSWRWRNGRAQRETEALPDILV